MGQLWSVAEIEEESREYHGESEDEHEGLLDFKRVSKGHIESMGPGPINWPGSFSETDLSAFTPIAPPISEAVQYTDSDEVGFLSYMRARVFQELLS